MVTGPMALFEGYGKRRFIRSICSTRIGHLPFALIFRMCSSTVLRSTACAVYYTATLSLLMLLCGCGWLS